ncbi:hypothetical protein KAI68_04525 [bacterium]|nr:hypothetical protein [bacterium]
MYSNETIQSSDTKSFCQYINCNCQKNLSRHKKEKTFFLYPANPPLIASTIERSAELLAKKHQSKEYLIWKNLKNEGKIVFCEICKAIFSSSLLICDITNLNFNVLFEIGFIVGLSKSFIPIFEGSYEQNKKVLSQVGLLDTIGYRKFANSNDIVNIVESCPVNKLIQRNVKVDIFRPIYYLKSPIDSDGSLRITSVLKKSPFNFRLYDAKERYRLPLDSALNEVDKSRAVIVHLIDPQRQDSLVHNARCAFVAGLALASKKRVLMIQEGKFESPIDYRDIVNEYETIAQIDVIMEDFIKSVALTLQTPVENIAPISRSELEEIDIGDIAAENEIENLRGYFVRTGEFNAARKGHVQIIVGRKGSGKTALFYALRHQINPSRRDVCVLDLKPEGYQFARLNEEILRKMTPAVRQHTLTALWDYVLLLELTHKILKDKKEVAIANRNVKKGNVWNSLREEYELHRNLEQGDFSERLNDLINKIIERSPKIELSKGSPGITELIFIHDIAKLKELLAEYLSDKEEVWLLFDNLDKNWKANKQNEHEVLILKALLSAGRKLKKMLVKRRINFHSIIFVRSDIYSFFLEETTDRGKEQVVYLNWDDVNLFKVMFGLRVDYNAKTVEDFNEIWTNMFDLHIGAISSFNYMIERTLQRPRDFLLFSAYALQTAINRGHNRINADDILQSEETYSRDLFTGLSYEISDVDSNLRDVLYCFLETEATLYENQIGELLIKGNIPSSKIKSVIEKLLWFGFLGILTSKMEERYAYSVGYDIRKLLKLSDWVQKENSERIYSIHPGFRKVLEIKNK